MALLDGELSHGPKGHGFESRSVTIPGCEFDPHLGWIPEGSQSMFHSHIFSVSPSLSYPLSPSLSKSNEKMSMDEDKNIIIVNAHIV